MEEESNTTQKVEGVPHHADSAVLLHLETMWSDNTCNLLWQIDDFLSNMLTLLFTFDVFAESEYRSDQEAISLCSCGCTVLRTAREDCKCTIRISAQMTMQFSCDKHLKESDAWATHPCAVHCDTRSLSQSIDLHIPVRTCVQHMTSIVCCTSPLNETKNRPTISRMVVKSANSFIFYLYERFFDSMFNHSPLRFKFVTSR